jgi:RimJ/RimL family protein N-acetyltransferase
MAEYPQNLVRHRVLFDGTPATIRPIRPEDSGMEQEFVRHLSDDSRYFRFMGSVRELPPKKLRFFTEIDYQRHMAFVATILREGQEVEIGVARYVATETPGSCEFAVTVDDAWHGTGVAGLLMISLMDAARERGFKTMEGIVLAENHKMLKFARQLGFRSYRKPGEAGTVYLELQL